jgi:hypothetical protein
MIAIYHFSNRNCYHHSKNQSLIRKQIYFNSLIPTTANAIEVAVKAIGRNLLVAIALGAILASRKRQDPVPSSIALR